MAGEEVLPEVTWRFAAGGVPAEAWVVSHVHVREAISDLYSCTVVLAMEADEGGLESLLGASAKLDMLRAGLHRAFQGVVKSVEELGTLASHRFVRVEVVPSLWLLSQRTDQRMFQNTNVIRVIQEVFQAAGVYQKGSKLVVDPPLFDIAPREYNVQYHETDLAFVRRLLEHEGIPFYFKHDEDGGEALVLAGDQHVFEKVPSADNALRVADEGLTTGSAEAVRYFDERHDVRTTGMTTRDFDFTRPRATLDMTGKQPSNPGRLAKYEYPAPSTITNYDKGSKSYKAHDTPRLAKLRAEEESTRVHMGAGRSNVSGMMPGRTFDLTGHARPDLDQGYLVTQVEHIGQAWSVLPENLRQSKRVKAMLMDAGLTVGDAENFDDRYANKISTHRVKQEAATVPFRPARVTPKPVVEGPQTARVTGPAGEDIHTDEHGRIKVQFHWDRVGQEDQNSSVWIRCAQSWAGGGWGFVFIPRIGMEVLVTFLEGDPDRPLVTGCVYNGENQPPYPLPDTKTKSTIKSWSTPRTGGYNEIRLEDAAGKEQMYVQAERDQDTLVKHDRTLTVGRHSTRDIGGDEHITVHQNRVTHIMKNDSFTVDENQDTEIHGPQGQSISIDNNQTINIGKNLQIQVGQKIQIVCGQSVLTMDSGGNIHLGGSNISITASGPVTVNGSVIHLN